MHNPYFCSTIKIKEGVKILNIVVFIKQVPDTNDVKWTQNNNIDRTNMESIMNPVDKQAIVAALKLKEQYNTKITAITMGPKKAIDVLKEAIAMGVDDAVLLCDPKFAGSDTCATSKVLAAAIKEKFPDTKLILCGQSAIDGETSQTGPSVAVRLEMPFMCHVNEITELNDNEIFINTDNENEKSSYKMNLPALVCVSNYVYKPAIPKIDGYIKAHEYNYKTYNLYELNLKEDETGVKGSPTYVSGVYKKEEGRNCKFIKVIDNQDYALEAIKQIKEIVEQ